MERQARACKNGNCRNGACGVVFELTNAGKSVWAEKLLYVFCKQAAPSAPMARTLIPVCALRLMACSATRAKAAAPTAIRAEEPRGPGAEATCFCLLQTRPGPHGLTKSCTVFARNRTAPTAQTQSKTASWSGTIGTSMAPLSRGVVRAAPSFTATAVAWCSSSPQTPRGRGRNASCTPFAPWAAQTAPRRHS